MEGLNRRVEVMRGKMTEERGAEGSKGMERRVVERREDGTREGGEKTREQKGGEEGQGGSLEQGVAAATTVRVLSSNTQQTFSSPVQLLILYPGNAETRNTPVHNSHPSTLPLLSSLQYGRC